MHKVKSTQKIQTKDYKAILLRKIFLQTIDKTILIPFSFILALKKAYVLQNQFKEHQVLVVLFYDIWHQDSIEWLKE